MLSGYPGNPRVSLLLSGASYKETRGLLLSHLQLFTHTKAEVLQACPEY